MASRDIASSRRAEAVRTRPYGGTGFLVAADAVTTNFAEDPR